MAAATAPDGFPGGQPHPGMSNRGGKILIAGGKNRSIQRVMEQAELWHDRTSLQIGLVVAALLLQAA
jgi:hypothetical protein